MEDDIIMIIHLFNVYTEIIWVVFGTVYGPTQSESCKVDYFKSATSNCLLDLNKKVVLASYYTTLYFYFSKGQPHFEMNLSTSKLSNLQVTNYL